MKSRTIKVDMLARVEGEGGLYLKIKGDRVEQVQLRIFEPPRFFEAFLRGRAFTDAPDITARICGICPVAYQMSSIHAMEDALGVTVPPAIRALRRLLYCGEWIESHILHVYMLHAPDFLGYEDAIRLAKDSPNEVRRGLEYKKIGNEIVQLVGGREIHPINVRVGGFYRAPSKAEMRKLGERLKVAHDAALATVRWVAGFEFPAFTQEYEFVALRHPDEYPFNEGRLVSNRGLDIAVRDYPAHFQEEHVAHSNALHSVRIGGGAYFTGPLARFNLNFDRLPASVQQVAKDAGLSVPVCNPFQSIVVRAVEALYAVEEARRIVDAYEPFDPAAVPLTPRAGVGHGCTEAPRGILYHRYRLAADGTIEEAQIVPPTSQNQKQMEHDLLKLVPQHLHLKDADLQWRCEQAVRNYDPCISCATHFLKLNIERNA